MARGFDLDVATDRAADTDPVVRPHPSFRVAYLVVEDGRYSEMVSHRSQEAFQRGADRGFAVPGPG